MTGEADWLSDPAGDNARADQYAKALEFSQLYLVFVQDPRGRELLAHWDKTLRRKTVPANASIQEYAVANANREFIEKIMLQIELAQQK